MAKTQFEYTRLWLTNNPQKAINIALNCIWGMYGGKDQKYFYEEKDNHLIVTNSFFQMLKGVVKAEGIPEMVKKIRHRTRAKVVPDNTHWIVSGSVAGELKTQTIYVQVPADSTPLFEFASVLYRGLLPEFVGNDEISLRKLVTYHNSFQILGPPLDFVEGLL